MTITRAALPLVAGTALRVVLRDSPPKVPPDADHRPDEMTHRIDPRSCDETPDGGTRMTTTDDDLAAHPDDPHEVGLIALNTPNLDDRRCANDGCGKPLNRSPEFVLQVSTNHVRWFCNDYCLIEGQQRVHDAIASLPDTWNYEADRPWRPGDGPGGDPMTTTAPVGPLPFGATGRGSRPGVLARTLGDSGQNAVIGLQAEIKELRRADHSTHHHDGCCHCCPEWS